MIWLTALYTVFLTVLIVCDDLGKLRFLVRIMDNFPFGDKFVHFFMIGALSFLVNRTAIQLSKGQNPKRNIIIGTLVLLVIFGLEEVSQIFIPGRTASFSDLAASYAGIVSFALLAFQISKRIKDGLVIKPNG